MSLVRRAVSAAVLAPRTEIGLTSCEVRKVREFVEANLQRNLTLSDMAAELHFSAFHFPLLFKVAMGVSPLVYLVQRRTERARRLLEHTDLPLHEMAARTGFADQSHLARHTRRWLGARPRDLRLGNSAIGPPDMQAAAK